MPAPPTTEPLPRSRRNGSSHGPAGTPTSGRDSHLSEIQRSHSRCQALGLSRIQRPDFAPIGRADLQVARDRNLRLHSHAAPIMEMLYDQIVNTQSMVVLCDAAGTVIHSIGDDDFLARASKVALAPGANWSESSKGTNAVGTALMAEAPMLVHADEHYLHANHFLTCSAAPILDPRGNILGVLDVSGDRRSYHQHTMALVKMSARMIENHWLADDYQNAMRLHFHSRVGFLGTLMEGILAVSPDGRFVGANRSALEQLNLNGAALRMQRLESLFDLTVGHLVDWFRSPLASPIEVRTDSGQSFHLIARFNWPVWSQVTEAAEASVPLTRDADPAGVAATQQRSPARGLTALLTGDPRVKAAVDKVRCVMDRDVPILIQGETGVGKSLLASAIHADSARTDRPFVSLNCAALSAADLDDQLSVGPAGRGARRAGPGSRVDGGTLFLQEVGDLPLAQQARLMSLWNEPAPSAGDGAGASAKPWVLIGSSSRPLAELVKAKAFREDLYYRLNGLTVSLPPLRQRADLLVLAQRILDAESAGSERRLSAAVQDLFGAAPWPGNVRQLFNVLRSAVLMAGNASQLEVSHLPEDFVEEALRCRAEVADGNTDRWAAAAPAGAPQEAAAALRTAETAHSAQHEGLLEDLQRSAIQHALDAEKGNISQAAKRLGVSRSTIYRKLRWHPKSDA